VDLYLQSCYNLKKVGCVDNGKELVFQEKVMQCAFREESSTSGRNHEVSTPGSFVSQEKTAQCGFQKQNGAFGKNRTV